MAASSFTEVEAEGTETAGQTNGGYDATGGPEFVPPGDQGGTLATQAPKEVGAPVDLEGTGIEGEVRRTDINIPKLTLVNALSKSRQEGEKPLGAFIFADEVILCAPAKGGKSGPEIDVIVLSLVKGYQQYVPFGSDLRPARASTMAEVRSLGGTLDRKDKTKTLFEETAMLVLLVPAPDDLDEADAPYFRHEFNGNRWAKAVLFVKSIAYTNVAKPVMTRVNNTGEATINCTFKLHSEFVEGEKFKWWTPKIKAGRLTTADEREWAKSKI